jgi:hypothetical protein
MRYFVTVEIVLAVATFAPQVWMTRERIDGEKSRKD